MQGIYETELAKLHDEFPILNDLEGTLDFRMREGETVPETLIWNFNAGMQQHLTKLGITERLKNFLTSLIRREERCICEGRIEFDHGRCKVCW